ncbi:MAG: OmpA/MotB family protein [Planctomycetota bacterium]|jgi:chemotaxis protein MotB
MMRTVKLSVFIVVCACIVPLAGCGGDMQDLQRRNASLNKRKADLEGELGAARLELAQLKRQLSDAQQKTGINVESLQQKIAALEAHLGKKDELISRMREQCLGGVPLPAELSTLLEDFAEKEDMITYDASTGIVKFKSDLLFKSGSDVVLPAAAAAIKSLSTILNSKEATEFDVIIAGHTDDQPIRFARANHPTNWHLSVHRAISVLRIMSASNVAQKRMSVRGFGELRPFAPNDAGNKGNPQNRRVEIYIVPKGM